MESVRPLYPYCLDFAWFIKFLKKGNFRRAKVTVRKMKLDAHHLLVDAQASPGPYIYRTFTEAASAAADDTTIYLQPDVYWTDDPADPNTQNSLIGLTLSQNRLRLIGLGEKPEDTVICGDRGQMCGALGNWNTLGIAGHDFAAENITFGNYCCVDLDYQRDPAKNHPRRTNSITQAQVIVPVGEPDRWTFDRCRFISLLNVFAYNRRMGRIYYKDCFFQCTDDSIGTGDLNVFENCRFVWYSNHPSGSACETLLVYAGCHFEGRLLYPDFDNTVYLAKGQHRAIAVLDCELSGNAGAVSWHVHPHPALRCYTYHNTFAISPDEPGCSLRLEEHPQLLRAFKLQQRYNIWNLLRGSDDWDPAGQKDMPQADGEIPWRIRLNPVTQRVAYGQTLCIRPEQYAKELPLQWKVDPEGAVEWREENGGVLLVNRNPDAMERIVTVTASNSTGLEGAGQYTLDFKTLPAPKLAGRARIKWENGLLSLEYALKNPQGTDCSQIIWYRSSNGEAAQAVPAAAGRQPYRLSVRDNGWFLLAAVAPRTSLSESGETVWSQAVWVDSVEDASYTTDFSDLYIPDNLASTGLSDVPEYETRPLRSGFWQIGAGRPLDYPERFLWYPKAEPSRPWTYGHCSSEGEESVKGLLTTHRGCRLLYTQPQAEPYQRQTWVIRPEKVAGQGFNSPTGQYLDLYIALDTSSMTGYGVRIERTPKYSNGVDFQLYSYAHESATPLGAAVSAGCFRGECTIVLILDGDRLTLEAESSEAPLQSQTESGLAATVRLEAQVLPAQSSGWGCWYTGGPHEGGRLVLCSFSYENRPRPQ